MNIRKTLISVLFVLACLAAASAQTNFVGKVVEVVDGKTVVIELHTGKKITAELQFIEVPEPEQQLHQVVKDHLRKLLLDKVVDFRPSSIKATKTAGTVYLNGNDVAMQMIRDGAAWHVSPDMSGQAAAEGDSYRSNELLAKTENLGVWSIPGLKPAWEFRAAREYAKRNVSLSDKTEPKETTPYVPVQTKPRLLGVEEAKRANSIVQIWPDLKKGEAVESMNPFPFKTDLKADYDGLYTLAAPDNSTAIVSTPVYFLTFSDSKAKYRGAMSMARISGSGPVARSLGVKDGDYLLNVVFPSERGFFASARKVVLTILAGDEKIVVVSHKKLAKRVNEGVIDDMLFKVSKSTMIKLAENERITLSLGRFTGTLTEKTVARVKSLKERDL
jgi:endonuclease YncB( thermonuclease family)